ncbi:hypothetical protein ES332_A05G461900v1 [Gossypium tomentosum]|uniref:C2H2-type domain-containing protein n=1 Tax=Gossypium tomentosum TaxID=34277 RepID=A0A5D2QT39_GOSTO|nr:hypothetical protein ES332_A05G461900v1 [Gossypium tomentosum]
MASNAVENVSWRDYNGFCNLCSKTFSNLQEVLHHQSIRHKDEIKFKCDLCNRGFPSREARNEHRTNGH